MRRNVRFSEEPQFTRPDEDEEEGMEEEDFNLRDRRRAPVPRGDNDAYDDAERERKRLLKQKKRQEKEAEKAEVVGTLIHTGDTDSEVRISIHGHVVLESH